MAATPPTQHSEHSSRPAQLPPASSSPRLSLPPSKGRCGKRPSTSNRPSVTSSVRCSSPSPRSLSSPLTRHVASQVYAQSSVSPSHLICNAWNGRRASLTLGAVRPLASSLSLLLTPSTVRYRELQLSARWQASNPRRTLSRVYDLALDWSTPVADSFASDLLKNP